MALRFLRLEVQTGSKIYIHLGFQTLVVVADKLDEADEWCICEEWVEVGRWRVPKKYNIKNWGDIEC